MKVKFKYFFILILISFITKGQPYNACFTVDKTIGCMPLTVNVTNCAVLPVGFAQPIYYYDFTNQPTSFSNSLTYTYTTAGTYTIRQLVNNGLGGTDYHEVVITVKAKPNPNFEIKRCDGKKVRVNILDNQYDSYEVNFGDGTVSVATPLGSIDHSYVNNVPKNIKVTGKYSFGCDGPSINQSVAPLNALSKPDVINITVTKQDNIAGTVALRITSIDGIDYELQKKVGAGFYSIQQTYTPTNNGVYIFNGSNLNTSTSNTFKVKASDACGNVTTFSNEISSLYLNTTIGNNVITLDWLPIGSATFDYFEVFKNGILLTNLTKTTFVDNNVVCNTNYCYKVVGYQTAVSTYSGTNIRSYSAEICVTAKSTDIPSIITKINSSFDETNHVVVQWNKPVSVSSYTIEDSNKELNSLTTESFKTSGQVVDETCYKIKYKDECNNESDYSKVTCPILLKLEKNEDEVFLNWTNYKGYYSTSVKHYEIEFLDESNQVVSSQIVGLNNSFVDLPSVDRTEIRYRIKAVPTIDEGFIAYSNIERIDLTARIFFPNTFTPNGDGDNDVFEIKGKYFKDLEVKVFNTWGELIFYSNNVDNSWDGTYNGNKIPNGSYPVLISASDSKGNPIIQKGIITLIR